MSPAIHEVGAESKVKFQPLLALFIHHLHNHYDLQGDTNMVRGEEQIKTKSKCHDGVLICVYLKRCYVPLKFHFR